MTDKELKQKVKRLEDEIDWLKTKIVDLQEEKGLAPVKTSYEVEVPDDIRDYYRLTTDGNAIKLDGYLNIFVEEVYQRGLAFETREQAERYDKKRILINKMNDWAKKHNGDWEPNWEDFREPKYTIAYEYRQFVVSPAYTYQQFLKVPYFKTKELAEQFIDEFGEEVKEVLC